MCLGISLVAYGAFTIPLPYDGVAFPELLNDFATWGIIPTILLALGTILLYVGLVVYPTTNQKKLIVLGTFLGATVLSLGFDAGWWLLQETVILFALDAAYVVLVCGLLLAGFYYLLDVKGMGWAWLGLLIVPAIWVILPQCWDWTLTALPLPFVCAIVAVLGWASTKCQLMKRKAQQGAQAQRNLSQSSYSNPSFPPEQGQTYQPYPGNVSTDGDSRTAYSPYPAGYVQPNRVTPANENTNILAVVAFALSFVVPLSGAICGHIALHKIGQTGESGRGLAIAALVIGYFFTVIFTITSVLSLAVWSKLIDLFSNLAGIT